MQAKIELLFQYHDVTRKKAAPLELVSFAAIVWSPHGEGRIV